MKYGAKFPTLLQPGLAGAERVFEFLDTPIEIEGSARGPSPEKSYGRDRVRETSPSPTRAGEPVLQDITVEIPAGSVVALVGASGAGKTTLADLVGRFYDVTSGRVTRGWRGCTGLDGFEFARSDGHRAPGDRALPRYDRGQHRLWGQERDGEEEIRRAARAANAHTFISTLPEGYDTVVGERGSRLSGGERQRVALARAILSNHPILIFDEATSALDTDSERLVQEAVGRLMGGRTVLVIAHRLSTVRRRRSHPRAERGTDRRAGRPCVPVCGGEDSIGASTSFSMRTPTGTIEPRPPFRLPYPLFTRGSLVREHGPVSDRVSDLSSAFLDSWSCFPSELHAAVCNLTRVVCRRGGAGPPSGHRSASPDRIPRTGLLLAAAGGAEAVTCTSPGRWP